MAKRKLHEILFSIIFQALKTGVITRKNNLDYIKQLFDRTEFHLNVGVLLLLHINYHTTSNHSSGKLLPSTFS